MFSIMRDNISSKIKTQLKMDLGKRAKNTNERTEKKTRRHRM